MKKELAIQLYSVRDRLTTREERLYTFKKLREYGYTQVQTAGFYDSTAEEFAADLKDAGLITVGTHIGMDVLENTAEAVRVHNLLGTTNAGVGGGAGCPADIKTLNEYINKVNNVAANLAKHGLKFTYHNHSIEFGKVGNEVVMDILVREFDKNNVSFVLDTYWVQNAGGFVNDWIEKLAGRIDILHLKDMAVDPGTNSTYDIELGSGNMNFKSIVKTAEAAGVKYYCYEQDDHHTINPMESAKVSAQYFFNELA